ESLDRRFSPRGDDRPCGLEGACRNRPRIAGRWRRRPFRALSYSEDSDRLLAGSASRLRPAVCFEYRIAKHAGLRERNARDHALESDVRPRVLTAWFMRVGF